MSYQPSEDHPENKPLTEEETQEFLEGNPTRSEVMQYVGGTFARHVEPALDGTLAFVIRLIRFMFVKSGAMTAEEFDAAFVEYKAEFESRFSGEMEETMDA